MNSLKMFVITLKIWLIFASVSIVSSMIFCLALGLISGLLVSLRSPMALLTTLVFCIFIVSSGIWSKIVSLGIYEKIVIFYKYAFKELGPIFEMKIPE